MSDTKPAEPRLGIRFGQWVLQAHRHGLVAVGDDGDRRFMNNPHDLAALDALEEARATIDSQAAEIVRYRAALAEVKAAAWDFKMMLYANQFFIWPNDGIQRLIQVTANVRAEVPSLQYQPCHDRLVAAIQKADALLSETPTEHPQGPPPGPPAPPAV